MIISKASNVLKDLNEVYLIFLISSNYFLFEGVLGFWGFGVLEGGVHVHEKSA